MHMGQVELKLCIYDQGSAQDIKKSMGYRTHAAGESRADVLKAALIQDQVINIIAQKLASQGLDDLETCLHPLFMKSMS